jgi:hypothetical protein
MKIEYSATTTPNQSVLRSPQEPKDPLTRPGAGLDCARLSTHSDRFPPTQEYGRPRPILRDGFRLIEAGQVHGVTVALVRGSDLDMSAPGTTWMAKLASESLARGSGCDTCWHGDVTGPAWRQRKVGRGFSPTEPGRERTSGP